MTEETDVARLVEHAGVVLVIYSVGIVVAAVGGNIVTLAGFLDIAVQNNLAIYGNCDVVALYANLLLAPFAQRLVLDALCRNDAIDRAVYLILAEAGIDGVVMVQNLHLTHALVGSINTHRSTDTYTIVDTRT